jgi:plasmid stabilization system protein ParE
VIQLRVSKAAAFSIVEQADYCGQAQDRALAQRWEDAVDQSVQSLLTLPERGTLCRFRSPELAGLRWIFVPGFSKHMIFYKYVPDAQSILIVQVLHGARNLETLLDEQS